MKTQLAVILEIPVTNCSIDLQNSVLFQDRAQRPCQRKKDNVQCVQVVNVIRLLTPRARSSKAIFSTDRYGRIGLNWLPRQHQKSHVSKKSKLITKSGSFLLHTVVIPYNNVLDFNSADPPSPVQDEPSISMDIGKPSID